MNQPREIICYETQVGSAIEVSFFLFLVRGYAR